MAAFKLTRKEADRLQEIVEAASPPSAEEFADRLAGLAHMLEEAGMHVCPHARTPSYCGCAPGRCQIELDAARRAAASRHRIAKRIASLREPPR